VKSLGRRGNAREGAGNERDIACVDLFCGIGGLTHGLIRGGVKVVAGVDLDPACRFPYETNNAAEFIEKDLQMLSGGEVKALFGHSTYTLLAGCAPCQPFSTYSRKGRTERKDTKWSLVGDFGRLVEEARPDFVTMENVPQLMDHAVFKRFLSSLKGYWTDHRIVECSDFGVPQTRKRLVLVASRLGPITLTGRSVNRHHRATVRDTIAKLPPLKAGASHPNDVLHVACSLSPLNMRRIQSSRPGGTWRDWNRELVATCHLKTSGETYPSVYGRMEWDKPAPTITTQCFGYGNGRFGHPKQDRAISLREAAMLQTFPSGYQFVADGDPVKFSVLGRLIGNAVPVRIGEVIASSFMRHVTRIHATRKANRSRRTR
jgi:DNA (cytosine-5)-methyltransferase 1